MSKTKKNNDVELSIFEVGEITCAINIDDIQEINKNLEITKVLQAPEYIRGMQNLRGTIITIIDIRVLFGMAAKEFNDDMRILVVENQDEKIGLLVDRILDVVQADATLFEAPPSNVQGVAGTYFSNVYKMEDKLAAILDVDSILNSKQGE